MMFIKDLTKPDIATMEIFQHMQKNTVGSWIMISFTQRGCGWLTETQG